MEAITEVEPVRRSEEKKLTMITPHGRWFELNLREVWDARELIWRFIHRDFVTNNKQTMLGPLWFVIPPLATTLIFAVIFGHVAKISTEGTPSVLFFMAGVIFWNYFAGCLNRTSNTFGGNSGLFGKIYIPRLTVPISLVISNLITLGVQLILFAGIYAWYYFFTKADLHPNLWVLALPFFLFQLAALGLGLGCIVSSLTTYYRDFALMLGFGIQLMMYASCVVTPLSIVPEQWRWLMALNPVVPVLEATRYALFGSGALYPAYLVMSIVTTAAVLFAGLVLFKRMERTFMDTI